MKIPGVSKDELRADSRAILSTIVRPSQDRSRVTPKCSPNARSYAFSNSRESAFEEVWTHLKTGSRLVFANFGLPF